jgi:hypothetical protein
MGSSSPELETHGIAAAAMESYRMRIELSASGSSKENPKFQKGQRVRINDLGVWCKIAEKGATGTVLSCGQLVTLQLDLNDEMRVSAPRFWDAIAKSKTATG